MQTLHTQKPDFSKIIYAPLTLQVGTVNLITEALAIPPSFFETSKTYWHGNTLETALQRLDGLLIESEEDNRDFPRQYIENGELKYANALSKSFRVANLTCVPDEPASRHQAVKFENDDFIRLRMKYAGLWKLRDEIHAPQIKNLILSLPFDHLSLVRLCVYEDGCFTPAHVDEPSQKYKKAGYHIINIILEAGQAQMVLKANGNEFKCPDRAFLFDFSYPHGVPKVQGRRILLCIEGKINEAELSKLIKWPEVVWSK
ncbi:MAG: hypothetical protein AB7O96_05815 [Pseudobdellovibrionaceae bacterium]